MAMKKNDSSFYVLLAALVAMAYIVFSKTPHSILSWDIFGYYLYLPFTFIYNDLGLRDFSVVENIIEKYQNTATFYQANWQPAGYWVMKYPMGMAILYVPWFAIGHLWAIFGSYELDGFSYPYQMSQLYGSFVYTVIGLIFFRKSMLKLFNATTTSVLLLTVIFGTNYLVHTVFHGQGLMSHNYLFFLFSLILWFTILWHERPLLKYALGLGITIGLAALSRPTEILVLAIPVLWNVYDKDSLQKKLNLLWLRRKDVIVLAGLILFFGSLQLIYFKIMTGKFLYNSYGGNAGEGMEFFSPYIWQVLFSFRKGWLVYTPLMGLALIGFVFLYRNRKPLFYSIFLFFVIAFYVVASWSCWWYADCLSQRALIPMYVFLAIPLGMLVEYVLRKKLWIRTTFGLLIFGLIAFNLFQSWQFLNGIIHSSRMTEKYYKAVFLKTSIPENAQKTLLVDRSLTPLQILESGMAFKTRNLARQHFEDVGITPDSSIIRSSNGKVFRVDENTPFSPAFDIQYKNLNVKEFGIIKIRARIFPLRKQEENAVLATATFMHNGYAYNYRSYGFTTEQLKPFQWNDVEVLYLTPEARKPFDVFRATFWLTGKLPVYIDDVAIDLLEPEE